MKKGIAAGVAKFGSIRGAINCAGVGTPCRVVSAKGVVHSLEQFQKVTEIPYIDTVYLLLH